MVYQSLINLLYFLQMALPAELLVPPKLLFSSNVNAERRFRHFVGRASILKKSIARRFGIICMIWRLV